MPQAPQFAAFDSTSTQTPLHFAWPDGHSGAHWPMTQTEPEPQSLPQPPQLFTSLEVSMQL